MHSERGSNVRNRCARLCYWILKAEKSDDGRCLGGYRSHSVARTVHQCP